ncbi:hypothetical protein AVEN_203462-1 [Araneus ventricosus]|uniref:Uncharacterized protein n=1 Tax=Araneus ventricosus TaxID=182803 RepID=A0A4Y2BHV4_ARAVE|nr:hypothetical protein AVEN_203462-1 [Araneus ventricosus]
MSPEEKNSRISLVDPHWGKKGPTTARHKKARKTTLGSSSARPGTEIDPLCPPSLMDGSAKIWVLRRFLPGFFCSSVRFFSGVANSAAACRPFAFAFIDPAGRSVPPLIWHLLWRCLRLQMRQRWGGHNCGFMFYSVNGANILVAIAVVEKSIHILFV